MEDQYSLSKNEEISTDRHSKKQNTEPPSALNIYDSVHDN